MADNYKSKGIKDPKDNIPLINAMLNSRVDRMLELCDRAKYVFFVYLNKNGDFIKIGDQLYSLSDFSELESCLSAKYKFKYSIINADDLSAKDMLEEYGEI